MKASIEKAIKEGGFLNLKNKKHMIVGRKHPKYHPTFPEMEVIQIWRDIDEETEMSNYLIKGVWTGTIHDLVFSTDFIDKLTINNKNPLRPIELDTIVCTNYKCEDNTYALPNEYYRNCERVEIDRLIDSCPKCIKGKAADYHRSQMANVKDIDKLKDYVRSLI